MGASRDEVAGLFGRVAADYDRAGFLHAVARRLVRQAGVLPGDRVLDLACGTGAALLEATRFAGQDGVVIGVDLAEPMVAQAARRLRALGWSRGGVAAMDAARLGLRPRSFDVVCCASAVYLLDDQPTALRRWRGRAADTAIHFRVTICESAPTGCAPVALATPPTSGHSASATPLGALSATPHRISYVNC